MKKEKKRSIILHFRGIVHLLKYFSHKCSQNYFASFNCSSETGADIPKLQFAPWKTVDRLFSKCIIDVKKNHWCFNIDVTRENVYSLSF